MTALLISHVRATDPQSPDELGAYLRGPHARDLLTLVPGLTSYTVYRDHTRDGSVRFTAVGMAPDIDAATLAAQIEAAAPNLTPSVGMVLDGPDAPRLSFADVDE